MIVTYSFLKSFYSSQSKVKTEAQTRKRTICLQNYVIRSELCANGKMTICSFDNPTFNIKSGTCISHKKM